MRRVRLELSAAGSSAGAQTGETVERLELSAAGSNTAAEALPTDERLERLRQGHADPQLVAQYFQYGRYLLIGSSRPGSLPATLQGIWNDSLAPPWGSKWTININTEMNYWPAEVTGLPECHRPLFDLVEAIRESGRRTARVHYGCPGFVVHHNTDLWGHTAPVDGPRWGMWPTGGAWLCLHLWEHYAFSRDRTFLAERTYPALKDAASFFLEYLVAHPAHPELLVTGPSISPENRYALPDGTISHLCFGPAMDSQILRDLFGRCIEGAEVLGVDEDLRARLAAARARLPAGLDRPVRAAPGVARGRGRARSRTPAPLAPVRPAPLGADHPPRNS